MTIRTWIHLRLALTLVIILRPIVRLLRNAFSSDQLCESWYRLGFLEHFISDMLDGALPSDNITVEYIDEMFQRYERGTYRGFNRENNDGK